MVPAPLPHSQDGSDVGLLRGSQELMTEAITSSATVTSNEFSGQCQIRPSILRQKLLSPNYGRIRQIRFLPREKSDLSVCCCGRMNYSACYYRAGSGRRSKELKHAITRALTIRDCSQAPYHDAVTFMLIIAGAKVWSNFFKPLMWTLQDLQVLNHRVQSLNDLWPNKVRKLRRNRFAFNTMHNRQIKPWR